MYIELLTQSSLLVKIVPQKHMKIISNEVAYPTHAHVHVLIA